MKRRQFVYVPEIDATTFLFFFAKGETDRSYSLRNFSDPTRYAQSLPYTAGQILNMAKWKFPAPTHSTRDVAFWKREIDSLNTRYLSKGSGPGSAPPRQEVALRLPSAAADLRAAGHNPRFPILDLEDLIAHPVKGSKQQDIERIFSSPQSEDYVTWNVARFMRRADSQRWWPRLLDLARADGAELPAELDSSDRPHVDLWRRYPPPPAYERASRSRMAVSGILDWAARAQDPRPVEGDTEVDVVFEGRGYLLFAEAKLGSDISMNTTYDPDRNQIVRNIDVLLESCGARSPVFWLIANDRGPSRAYVRLMRSYREDPRALLALLPHRSSEQIERVKAKLAIILWRDLLGALEPQPGAVLDELLRRAEFTERVEGYGLVQEASSEPRLSIGLVRSHLARQPTKAVEADADDQEALLTEISRRRNRIELALRTFLREGLHYSEGKRAMHVAMSALPEERRALLNQHSYAAVWGELYLSELAEILGKNFSVFQKRVGEDKATVLGWMKHVNQFRSDAHAKRLSAEDLAYLRVCFKRLEEMLSLH